MENENKFGCNSCSIPVGIITIGDMRFSTRGLSVFSLSPGERELHMCLSFGAQLTKFFFTIHQTGLERKFVFK